MLRQRKSDSNSGSRCTPVYKGCQPSRRGSSWSGHRWNSYLLWAMYLYRPHLQCFLRCRCTPYGHKAIRSSTAPFLHLLPWLKFLESSPRLPCLRFRGQRKQGRPHILKAARSNVGSDRYHWKDSRWLCAISENPWNCHSERSPCGYRPAT